MISLCRHHLLSVVGPQLGMVIVFRKFVNKKIQKFFHPVQFFVFSPFFRRALRLEPLGAPIA
jgi:hypothetical protein